MDDIKIITNKLGQLTYKGKTIKLKDVVKMCDVNLVMICRDDEETERFKKFLSIHNST